MQTIKIPTIFETMFQRSQEVSLSMIGTDPQLIPVYIFEYIRKKYNIGQEEILYKGTDSQQYGMIPYCQEILSTNDLKFGWLVLGVPNKHAVTLEFFSKGISIEDNHFGIASIWAGYWDSTRTVLTGNPEIGPPSIKTFGDLNDCFVTGSITKVKALHQWFNDVFEARQALK